MAEPTVPVADAKPQGALGSSSVPKLELKGLYISYTDRQGKTVQAVEDVNLTIANKPGVGELAVFLGPSGCGKSTILKAICGLLRPDSGEVLIDGVRATGTGRDRGMVFQNYTSFAWRSVRKNVEYGLELQGIPAKQRKEQALAIIEQVGLKDFAEALPKQLSGGMKQRVAIARTLINKPKLLLMDEPFGALDVMTREQMNLELMRIWSESQKTTILITHSIQEAVFLADRVVVMTPRPGRVAALVDVDLPRPRLPETRLSPRFLELAQRVGKLIGLDFL